MRWDGSHQFQCKLNSSHQNPTNYNIWSYSTKMPVLYSSLDDLVFFLLTFAFLTWPQIINQIRRIYVTLPFLHFWMVLVVDSWWVSAAVALRLISSAITWKDKSVVKITICIYWEAAQCDILSWNQAPCRARFWTGTSLQTFGRRSLHPPGILPLVKDTMTKPVVYSCCFPLSGIVVRTILAGHIDHRLGFPTEERVTRADTSLWSVTLHPHAT